MSIPRDPATDRFVARAKTSFIDRSEEIKILRNAVDNALLGIGGLIVLKGESGVGKTRLTKEIEIYAREKGMQTLHAICPILFNNKKPSPYVLWKSLIRDYLHTFAPINLRLAIGNYPEEICQLVPEIKYKLGYPSESHSLKPKLEQERLFEAVAQFIANISHKTPLLMVLDDLHWSDVSSLMLLHYLARGINREQILVLGAYREEKGTENSGLLKVLNELNKERLAKIINLKRMGKPETIQMIKLIIRQDRISERFCDLIHSKTHGNPFFIEELITSLIEEGIIYLENDFCKIKSNYRLKIPKTIRNVFEAKLDKLDKQSLDFLKLASCFENPFALEDIEATSGILKPKLIDQMEKMMKRGFFESKLVKGKIIFSFVDEVLRNIVYDEIDPFKKIRFHHNIGNMLEKIHSQELDEYLGELGSHFLKGGEKSKAIEYFIKAGMKAKQLNAYDEAEAYYQSAIDLIEKSKPTLKRRAEIHEILGDLQSILGKHESSIKQWEQGISLITKINKQKIIATIHRKIAHEYWSKLGNQEKAKEHHKKSKEILKKEAEDPEMAYLNADISRMYFRAGDLTNALTLANETLTIAKKQKLYEIIANAYLTLGAIHNLKANKPTAISFFEKALKMAITNKCLETAVYAYDNLGWALRETARKQWRLDCYRNGYNLAKKIGIISAQSWIGNNLAEMYIGMSDTREALKLRKESASLDRKSGNIINLILSLGGLGHVYDIIGDWCESERYLEEALDLSKKTDDFPAIGLTYKALGIHYINTGEFEKSREYGEKAFALSKKAKSRLHQIISCYYSTICLIELKELEQAEKNINKLQKLVQQLQDKQQSAYIEGLCGMLYRAKKDWKKALMYFESSYNQLNSLNATAWDAYEFAKRIILEYARIFLERNQKEDKRKAYALLNEALSIFKRIGAKREIEFVETRIFELDYQFKILKKTKPFLVTITGTSNLDKMLLGGIPNRFSVALASSSCDEKDIILRNFLETGIRQNEVTFHITDQEPNPEYLVKENEAKYYLFYCNPRPKPKFLNQINTYILQNQTDLTNLNIALIKAYRTTDQSPNTPKRALVEIASEVLLRSKAELTRRWLEDLLYNFKQRGFTILATINPLMHSSEQLHSILDLFDGEIGIIEKDTKTGIERPVVIKRMRNTDYMKEPRKIT